MPPEDPAALAAALSELTEDPVARRRMGAAGIHRVAEGWDVEVGVTQLLTLLRRVLGEVSSDLPTAASARIDP